MHVQLEGVMPALLTPFKEGGTEIDFDKAAAWAEKLADRGVQGIFAAGSSGEGLLMSAEERKQLACVLVDAVGSRINVVMQTGCLDTQQTIDITRHAVETGVRAVGIYSPAFYRYDDRAMFRHYQLIAEAVPEAPILLYNIPRYTGNHLSVDLIVRLAEEFDSVVGMKDSSGDIGQLSRVICNAPEGFLAINGADEFSYQAYLTGACGAVSLTANVIPELFVSVWKDVKAGEIQRALTTQNRINDIIEALGAGGTISMYKEALRLMGIDTGFVRPPQREIDADEKKALAKRLTDLGLL